MSIRLYSIRIVFVKYNQNEIIQFKPHASKRARFMLWNLMEHSQVFQNMFLVTGQPLQDFPRALCRPWRPSLNFTKPRISFQCQPHLNCRTQMQHTYASINNNIIISNPSPNMSQVVMKYITLAIITFKLILEIIILGTRCSQHLCLSMCGLPH